MKTIPLALAVLALSISVGDATAAPVVSSHPALSANAHLVQLGVLSHALPVSPGIALALIALLVVGLRIMAVHHARHMADHERDSHHGKAQMFRDLHAERAPRL